MTMTPSMPVAYRFASLFIFFELNVNQDITCYSCHLLLYDNSTHKIEPIMMVMKAMMMKVNIDDYNEIDDGDDDVV